MAATQETPGQQQAEPQNIGDLLDNALSGLDLDAVFDGPKTLVTDDDAPDSPDGDDTDETEDEEKKEVKPDAEKPKTEGDADPAKAKGESDAAKKESGESGDEVPKGLTGNAAVKWKELRAETKAAKEETERIRAELAEAQKAKADPAELAQLRAELEEAKKSLGESEGELQLSRVTGTIEFKNAITKPKGAILDLAGAFAEKYNIPKEQLVAALSEPDQNKQGDLLSALAATFNDRDKGRLFRMGDDLLELNEREKLLLENSRTTMERIEAKRKADGEQLAAASKTEYSGALDAVEAELRGKGKFFNTEGEGVDADHAKAVKSAFDLARKVDIGTLNPQGRAYAAYAGATLPLVLGNLAAAHTEIARLTAELEKVNAADPGVGAGDPDDGGSDDAAPVDANDAFEQASRQLSRKG